MLRSLSRNVQANVVSSDDQTADFQREAEHFAECVRTGSEPRTPGEEGLKDLLAMEAIYRAAGTPMA